MGGLLGGGSGGGGGSLLDPLGIFGGGGKEGGGGGFLSGILGGLPDPLGAGKMLGITGQEKPPMDPGAPPGGPIGPPPAEGVNYAPQPPQGPSLTVDPNRYLVSPMSPTGMGVGGGGKPPGV